MKVCAQLIIIKLRDEYFDIFFCFYTIFSLYFGCILPLQYLDYRKSQIVLQPISLFNKDGTQDGKQLQKHAKYQEEKNIRSCISYKVNKKYPNLLARIG